ncbi:GDSL-type esterase/lipase family protein [Harryflintia acetispora]|uniref:GDSL-type esterase/lipase family protein n=1 Tax=Harryflintia acetispora TaxID=1849041 RepID=UPI00189940A9|nr:GDSL-type esterase/lipase family protein [Harryflintia acetispora]
MNVKIDRSRRPRRNYTVLVAVIAILLAIIIPTGLILLKNGFQKENPLPPEEPESLPSSSEESSSEPEEEPVFNLSSLYLGVPESAQVEQSYFDDAAFFGDSITNGISVYAFMSNAEVIAATGVNPDSVLTKEAVPVEGEEQRITMIEALRRSDPKKIYIQLGANWVGTNTGIDKETFLHHYRDMLRRIRSEHPQSVVYLQSMFPVSRAFSSNENGKNGNGLTIEIIKDYNESLRQLASEEAVFYLDIYPALADEEGYLPDDATADGMHLTSQYYEHWFHFLRTHTVEGAITAAGFDPGRELVFPAPPELPKEETSSNESASSEEDATSSQDESSSSPAPPEGSSPDEQAVQAAAQDSVSAQQQSAEPSDEEPVILDEDGEALQ